MRGSCQLFDGTVFALSWHALRAQEGVEWFVSRVDRNRHIARMV